VSEAAPQQPSLYRRYRPRTFADVVGQEPVVRTLRNAVERDRVHHAYLFVGSRGTGKTSMAKILAACLNCERGPTVEPCGECESCRAIARASSMDVVEMDAASNNSVEDIRELRDSVAYAPTGGGTKVYILDEAHMLSTAAWNAFLKTLEEPPPRTVFVLATTEAGKVPATVVDRTHRFDFMRPTVEQLASVVRRTAQAESIEIPPAAVAAVARAATGSFRDALGTLEQLVAYSGRTIALEDVLAVLGVTDVEQVAELLDAVQHGDAAAALRAVAACAQAGRDAGAVAGDVQTRARELMVVQTLGEVPRELSLTPEHDAALLAQSERVGAATVVRLLELLGGALEAVRAGADPRTQLELALVKAARPEVDGSVKALALRIERLEGTTGVVLEGGPPGAARGGRVAGALAVEEVLSAGAPTEGISADPAAAAAGVVTEQSPVPPARTGEPTAPPTETYEPQVPSATALSTNEPALPTPAPHAEEPSPPAAQSPPASHADAPPLPAAAHADAPSPPPTHAEEPSPPPTHADAHAPPPARPPSTDSLQALRDLWPSVVEAVRAPNAMLAAAIAEAVPVGLDGTELRVAFDATAPFMKKKAEDPNSRAVVDGALRELTGQRLRVAYELREQLTVAVDGDGSHTEEEWVARFVDEFDAEELAGEWAAQPSEKGE
jgi:DNA polymerase-3 subunit gamma/tau